MPEILSWLENSAVGIAVRESTYGFPLLVGVHLMGLILSAGILLWVDLRMLGVCFGAHRLAEIYEPLRKWFAAGFLVMFASGLSLFAGFATDAWDNTFFRIKMLAMLAAGVNALVFHLAWKRAPAGADQPFAAPPGFVRAAGAVSIACWALVILCGRMMAYTLYD